MQNLADLKARMVPGQRFALPETDDGPIEAEYIVNGVAPIGFTYLGIDDSLGARSIHWTTEANWSFSHDGRMAKWHEIRDRYIYLRILLPLEEVPEIQPT